MIMDNLDFPQDGGLVGYDCGPSSRQRFPYLPGTTWPLPFDQNMSQGPSSTLASTSNPNDMTAGVDHNGAASTNANASTLPSRRANTTGSNHPTTTGAATNNAAALRTSGLPYYHSMSMNPSAALTTTADWSFQQPYPHDASLDALSYSNAFGGMQASPVDFMPTTQPSMSTSLAMDAGDESAFMTFSGPYEPAMNAMAFQMQDFRDNLINYPITTEGFQSADLVSSSIQSGSPPDTWLDVRPPSYTSSENDWTEIGHVQHSFDMETRNTQVVNPEALHIRTSSNSSQQSDVPRSAGSIGSFEDIFPISSPQSDHSLELAPTQRTHGLPHVSHHDHEGMYPTTYLQPSVSPQTAVVEPITIKQSPSSSTSPTSSGLSSPPARLRKTPGGVLTQKASVKKSAPARKDNATEKRVGRRKGPLQPHQRQQAHEIRKLRACLRCKFLKKTCDKGDPCGGCQPSHARLWQVPCTRIDIKDIAFFMKDWKADYERHISLGFSVGNIKGFSATERPLYITHGYGYYLPIKAREVYVRDDSCFGMDWVETLHEKPREFEVGTNRLSAGLEGIQPSVLSEYLDRHLDGGFENFVDEYFEGTYFLTEILKTAYRYYLREKQPVIRKALKLVVAYNLTLHVTMVDGLSDEERVIGLVEDSSSKFFGMTVAPVMINFQVKCALADMWRELQKDILEELSALFSSVYSGDKLKNWPTIFMLAAILLAIWEEMQFDCHYRVPDQAAVSKFCTDMESTPVGVIVGLFSAISQKLPSFSEWNTESHKQVLGSNPAVCDAMTEVRAHVCKYEPYLKSRPEAKFDRDDFDSLSNKFLSKLVIRAN